MLKPTPLYGGRTHRRVWKSPSGIQCIAEFRRPSWHLMQGPPPLEGRHSRHLGELMSLVRHWERPDEGR